MTPKAKNITTPKAKNITLSANIHKPTQRLMSRVKYKRSHAATPQIRSPHGPDESHLGNPPKTANKRKRKEVEEQSKKAERHKKQEKKKRIKKRKG